MENEPWSHLPLEVACGMISRITDVRDISRLLQTSRSFRYLANNCIDTITTKDLVVVPAPFLDTLTRIKSIDPHVVIEVTRNDIPTIASLQWLNEAHFLVISPEDVSELLQALNLKNGNFKISIETNEGLRSIIIQRGSYLILPTMYMYGSSPELIGLVSSVNPNLQQIIISTEVGYTYPTLMAESLRKFLYLGDFGLIDPTSPPSPTNPTISSYLTPIIESDTITNKLAQFLLRTYVLYHQLSYKTYVYMDKLMIDMFGAQPGPNPHQIRYVGLSDLVHLNLLEDQITPYEVANFNIPSVLITIDDLNRILNIVSHTHDVLRGLHSQQINHFKATGTLDPNITYYKTDGSVELVQYS